MGVALVPSYFRVNSRLLLSAHRRLAFHLAGSGSSIPSWYFPVSSAQAFIYKRKETLMGCHKHYQSNKQFTFLYTEPFRLTSLNKTVILPTLILFCDQYRNECKLFMIPKMLCRFGTRVCELAKNVEMLCLSVC